MSSKTPQDLLAQSTNVDTSEDSAARPSSPSPGPAFGPALGQPGACERRPPTPTTRADVSALVSAINKRNSRAMKPQHKEKARSRQNLSSVLSKIFEAQGQQD